jgi:hypothetical protein
MAIAYDASVDGGNANGGTLSFNLNTGALTDGRIFIHFMLYQPGTVITVTVDGNAATLVGKENSTGKVWYQYTYALGNCSAGNKVIAITNNYGNYYMAGASSYSGMSQSATPDATTVTNYNAAANSLTTSITTNTDNAWTILTGGAPSGGGAPTAGSGSTLRTRDASYQTWGAFDSGAAVTPAGSKSMTYTMSGTNQMHAILSAWAPAAAAGTPLPVFLHMRQQQ